MLSQQEISWTVYAAIYLLFSALLICRCRHNYYLIPFILFSLLIAVGHLFLIGSHAVSTDAMVNHNSAFSHIWISKSLVLSVLPALSFLVFLGIMESQLIFIRHITAAMQNRDYWGSLYLRQPEKKVVPLTQQRKNTSQHKSWTYWFSLFTLFLYTLIAFISIILFLAIPDTQQKSLGVALCASLLLVVLCINTGAMIFFTRKNAMHGAQLIRRNRDDLIFLRITPVFFTLGMAGTTILSWLYYASTLSSLGWILLESFLVHAPFLSVLLMCIHTGKFKKMGRQYRIEEDQKLYNPRTYLVVQQHHQEIIYPPPPTYPY